MNNREEYKDIVAFHPGYYIAEMIVDMGMTQEEFAQRLGTTAKTISLLVNGKANLTKDIAKKLSTMLGTSSEIWLNLQSAYERHVIEIEQLRDFDEQEVIALMIDYSYFEKVCNLVATKNIKERIINLCKCLMIADLRILAQPDFLVNFRTGVSSIEMKNIVNAKAWIQIAMNCSKYMETASFDAEKLKAFLPEIRSMTIQAPENFLPRLKDIFSQCGVAFVLLPHLKNSGVNGAVKWLSQNQVVLAMNDRGLYADRFWFSLFHEIKHVLQQKIKTTFVSCSETEMISMNSSLEKEADQFAADYLIPKSALRKWKPTRYTSDDEICAFAKSIGIHPGIVVGRLQHESIIPQSRGSALKEKYHIVL